MHRPRHSLGLVAALLGLVAALLGGTALDAAYTPKAPGLAVWVGRPRDSNRYMSGFPQPEPRPMTMKRREWRAATKADRRALKKAERRERGR